MPFIKKYKCLSVKAVAFGAAAFSASAGDMLLSWLNVKKFVSSGDSFRCFMTDYLAKDFSHCVIAHRDYTEGLAESIREADILVISAGLYSYRKG